MASDGIFELCHVMFVRLDIRCGKQQVDIWCHGTMGHSEPPVKYLEMKNPLKHSDPATYPSGSNV